MRKSITRRRTTIRRSSRRIAPHSRKKSNTLQTVVRTMRAKLKNLKKEFKSQLKTLTELAYIKGRTSATRENIKKNRAKQRVLAKAEMKFEKKYASKQAKMGRKHAKKRGVSMRRTTRMSRRRRA